jgi:hypothetical protein
MNIYLGIRIQNFLLSWCRRDSIDNTKKLYNTPSAGAHTSSMQDRPSRAKISLALTAEPIHQSVPGRGSTHTMPSLKAPVMELGGGSGVVGATTTTILQVTSLLRTRSERSAKAEEKVEWVRSQLVGRGAEFETPFGRRALVYADHTATGQSLRYIEDYIVKHVLPFYGQYCICVSMYACLAS